MTNNQKDQNGKRELFIEFVKIIVYGLFVYLIQAYFTNSWGPTTAAETLKKENYINAKRDTYYQALDIVNREISGFNFNLNIDTVKYKRMKGATLPTEFEVNSCLAKLHIYSNNDEIINSYKKIFAFKGGLSDSVIHYQITLLKNIKKDLSDVKSAAISNYEYIVVNRDTTFR